MNSSNIDELIKSTSINDFLPGYNECKGYMLGYRYNENKDQIDNLEVRDSDIWVCTYPKTGTTWTQEMVWLLVNNLDYEAAKYQICKRFPFIEIELMANFKLLEDSKSKEDNYPFLHSIEHTKTTKANPRCIKTHLAWDLLPKAIQNKEKRPKIIHVVRNPKDTCVSYYHHYLLLHDFKGTFDDFATLFLNDKVLWSPYWDCLESYWKQRNEPNVLTIRYEDMKKDLKSVVLKVAKFLDKTLSDDEMEKLLHHLSFNSMKDNPHTSYEVTTKDDTVPKGRFIRKGIVGDFKNIMTPELIEKFDKWIEEKNKIGMTF